MNWLEVKRLLRYQAALMGIAAATLSCVWVVRSCAGASVDPARFFALGELSVVARGVDVVAEPGETWAEVATRFALIAGSLTSAVVWLQTKPRARVAALAQALPWSLFLSLLNAGSEEMIFRIALGQALFDVVSPEILAAVSGTLFGLLHWKGRPGGLPGVLMAGFLGWILAHAMLQTGGFVVPVALHYVMDVAIFTIMLATPTYRSVGTGRAGTNREPSEIVDEATCTG